MPKYTPKICYIGKFKQLWDEECIALSFEALGCEVLRIEEEQEKALTFDGVLQQIDEFQPQIVMWAKMRFPFKRRAFQAELKKRGIKTVCWLFDIYFGYPNRELYIEHDPAFAADYVFTTDGGHNSAWKKYGINHHTLRQGIFKPHAFISENKIDTAPIVFVGCENEYWDYRTRLMLFLQATYGDQFHWYGKTDTNEIRGTKLNDLYSSAKIIIGDSYYSPYYWSNRIYETIGRGGFTIFPDIPGLSDEFTPYRDYIPYTLNDFGSLVKKINYFLKADAEREAIRRSGFERCKNNYTYEDRCRTLLNVVQST